MSLHLAAFRGRHVESWYAATAGQGRVHPRLEQEETLDADVCVIGGGFTGLNCALELSERGIDTVLLEGGLIGCGASGRCGGLIRHGFASPPGKIEHQLGREAGRLCWALSWQGIERLAAQVHRYGIDCDLQWGAVTTAANARQMRKLHARHATLQALGYTRTRLVEGDALREDIDSPHYVGGLHDSGCGHLHPLRYAQGLARAATGAGVRIFEDSRATGIAPRDRRVEIMTARGARIRAQHLVLACNVDIATLAPELGARLLPFWSHIIATEVLDIETASRLLPRQAAICDCSHALGYFRLSSDRRLLFGAQLLRPKHRPADILAERHAALARVFPDLAGCSIDYSWGGYLDRGLGMTPQFGRLSPRIYYAQGFAGHGVALSGMAGQLMAEAIDTGSSGFDLFAQMPAPRIPLHALTAGPLSNLGATLYGLCDRLGV